jgi:hypothetical protein
MDEGFRRNRLDRFASSDVAFRERTGSTSYSVFDRCVEKWDNLA